METKKKNNRGYEIIVKAKIIKFALLHMIDNLSIIINRASETQSLVWFNS